MRGWHKCRILRFEVIGNLDADMSFDPDYHGISDAKSFPKIQSSGLRALRSSRMADTIRPGTVLRAQNHVAGGCQLFRRECFREIGGYIANLAEGMDWIASMTARMKGWKARSFPENAFIITARWARRERVKFHGLFSYGGKDYYLGNSPVWQLFRATLSNGEKAVYRRSGFALFCGYCWAR